MKKIKLLALAPLFAALMVSCGNNSDNENGSPVVELESYRYDVIAQLTDTESMEENSSDIYCKVSGQGVLPKKIGNLDITALQDSLSKAAEIIVVNKNIVQPSLSSEFELTSKDPETTEAGSVMVNELCIDLLTPQLIVWKDYSYYYPYGAAHGMYSTIYLNFSIEKGKLLTLEDIFVAGYESALRSMIVAKLKEQNVTLLTPENEINVPSDYRITNSGIEFIYGIYEIAPYSEGEIKVELQRYELNDLFAPGAEKMIFGDSFD